MMRKSLAALMTLALLACMLAPLSALAGVGGTSMYVVNPNPSDRLHLRVGTDTNERSLGKYYNGTSVFVLQKTSADWYKVKVGQEPGALTGYMMSKYLKESPGENYIGHMPVYVATQKVKVYQQPEYGAKTGSIAMGRRVYLMGFTDDWWHLFVARSDSSDFFFCFAPANAEGLTLSPLAYISNPDKADRLHLRAKPWADAKSLGKYYNGSVARILGHSTDFRWTYVDLYGHRGYMNNDFLCFEEQVNNTYYGLVDAYTTRAATLYDDPQGKTALMKLAKGQKMLVYGVLDGWLHVQVEGVAQNCFIKTRDTDFVD